MQRFAGINESSRQVSENLRMASNWFLVRSTGQYNLDAYADEHALGEQRYFNLQCLIYGSDPARYLGIVTEGDLPEARAKGCPDGGAARQSRLVAAPAAAARGAEVRRNDRGEGEPAVRAARAGARAQRREYRTCADAGHDQLP